MLLGFLDLPPEIRIEIYKFAAVDSVLEASLRATPKSHLLRCRGPPINSKGRWQGPGGLLLTCKTVQWEMMDILWKATRFVVRTDILHVGCHQPQNKDKRHSLKDKNITDRTADIQHLTLHLVISKHIRPQQPTQALSRFLDQCTRLKTLSLEVYIPNHQHAYWAPELNRLCTRQNLESPIRIVVAWGFTPGVVDQSATNVLWPGVTWDSKSAFPSFYRVHFASYLHIDLYYGGAIQPSAHESRHTVQR